MIMNNIIMNDKGPCFHFSKLSNTSLRYLCIPLNYKAFLKE